MAEYVCTVYNTITFKPGRKWLIQPKTVNRLFYIHRGDAWYDTPEGRRPFRPGFIYIIPQQFDFHPGYDNTSGFTHTFVDFLSTDVFSFRTPVEIEAARCPEVLHALEALDALFREFGRDSLGCRENVTLLFAFIMNRLNFHLDLGYIGDDRVTSALARIQERFSDSSLSVGELARAVWLDAGYFSRLFQRTVDMTPRAYIKNFRMLRAIGLLRQGMPVTDAASACGYRSVSAFSTAFRQYTGNTPTGFAAEKLNK